MLDLVHAERFSFVGLSLGGAVGMHLALEAPDRLERLVLAATSRALRHARDLGRADRARPQRRHGRRRRRRPPALVHAGVRRRANLPRDARLDAARGVRALLRAPARASTCAADLGAIAAPTLAIAGAEDPTSPPEHLEAIAAEIPNARLVVIPRGAHLVNVERADEFNDALLAHLA